MPRLTAIKVPQASSPDLKERVGSTDPLPNAERVREGELSWNETKREREGGGGAETRTSWSEPVGASGWP